MFNIIAQMSPNPTMNSALGDLRSYFGSPIKVTLPGPSAVASGAGNYQYVKADFQQGDFITYYSTGLVEVDEQDAGYFPVHTVPFGTPSNDATSPTIDAFSVAPTSVMLGDSFTISYTVSDAGGSHLKQVELWRANVDGTVSDPSWAQIGSAIPLSSDGPSSGSFPTDTPSTVGDYWYGLHVVDNASPVPNVTTERQAGKGPLQRVVNPASCSVTSPTTPAGPSNAQTGQNLNYTTGNSTCSNEHSVEYRFDWGDGGSFSSWDGATRVKSYASTGTYVIRAQARCSSTLAESSWSGGVSVQVEGSDESWKAPTETGKSDKAWTNPENAFGSDGLYATATGAYNSQDYYSFHFDVPAGAAISGVEVAVTGQEKRQEATMSFVRSIRPARPAGALQAG